MNPLKEKIKRREPLCGTHIFLRDPALCEIMSSIGFDFIWVDLEHTAIDCADLLAHLNAAKVGGTPIIVRVPQHDLTYTKKVVEMGPEGIIFPMIHSKKEAEEVLDFTLFPPYGHRGFGPQRAIRYGVDDPWEFVREGSLEMCRFLQVENVGLMNELPELAKNPFIDGFIFGPNDFSGSLNMLGRIYEEPCVSEITKAIRILKEANAYVGLSTGSTDGDTLRFWKERGVDMLSIGGDSSYIRCGSMAALETVRKVQQS